MPEPTPPQQPLPPPNSNDPSMPPGGPKPQPVPATTPERKGKFALVGPRGAFDWWEINDLEKMYAVVTIQASFPNAEQVVRTAWEQITSAGLQVEGE